MNKYNNLFGQIIGIIGKKGINRIGKELGVTKNLKGYGVFEHFATMLYCMLTGSNSLREICNGMASGIGKLKHIGMQSLPKKSTLAYANEHRSWELFKDIFYELKIRIEGEVKEQFKHPFRFKNRLLSFDGSIIDLCLNMYDWAKFRKTKGAIKLHLLLDHSGYLPEYLHISEGNVHEVKILNNLTLEKGTIIAIDKGLVDYAMFEKWTKDGIYFVTRLKTNACYETIETNELPQKRHILKDEIIKMTGTVTGKKCPSKLRIVESWDENKKESIVILTNNLHFGATTIASIYRERWQIEIFFKTIKQNLKIKTFIGTSKNAVLIQIWSALICLLLLKYLKAKSKIKWSLSNLFSLIRLNLLTYRNLWTWLNNPFDTIPIVAEDEQLLLFDIGQHMGVPRFE